MHTINLGFYTPENKFKISSLLGNSGKIRIKKTAEEFSTEAQLRSYYYDEDGKICMNALLHKVNFTSNSDNPYKYRSLDSKVNLDSKKTPTRPSSKLLKRRETLTPKSEVKFLNQSI